MGVHDNGTHDEHTKGNGQSRGTWFTRLLLKTREYRVRLPSAGRKRKRTRHHERVWGILLCALSGGVARFLFEIPRPPRLSSGGVHFFVDLSSSNVFSSSNRLVGDDGLGLILVLMFKNVSAGVEAPAPPPILSVALAAC